MYSPSTLTCFLILNWLFTSVHNAFNLRDLMLSSVPEERGYCYVQFGFHQHQLYMIGLTGQVFKTLNFAINRKDNQAG